jgi:hypothetical protein
LRSEYAERVGLSKKITPKAFGKLKEIRLKALDNFSPEFALKPWGQKGASRGRNSEGVATGL